MVPPPSSSPVPFLMARSILSTGMDSDRAAAMAVRSRGLKLGSPPKRWVATVISLASLEKRAPRLTSEAPLARLILDQ